MNLPFDQSIPPKRRSIGLASLPGYKALRKGGVALLALAGFLLSAANPCLAQDSNAVVASIKPVHSLVAAVMGDTGIPVLLVQGPQSPHHLSMKPSTARALQQARLVFRIDPTLEAFLAKPLQSLSAEATVVTLSQTKGIKFVSRDSEENVDETAGIRHGARNLHLWTDPANAIAMLAEIENSLARLYPENASVYQTNVLMFADRLKSLQSEIETALRPFSGKKFLTLHNAYDAFNARFRLQGGMAIEHHGEVSAKRIASLRSQVKRGEIACVFGEAGENPALVQTLAEGSDARTGTLDALGKDLKPGPELYEQLIRKIAETYLECFRQTG